MTRPVRLRLAALVAMSCAALATWSCFDQVAGNGSEVENAVVLGRVVLPDGRPAAGVRMQLLPSDHDARKDAAPAGSYVAVTEKDGTFRLKAKPGQFSVFAAHSQLGYRLLVPGMSLAPYSETDAGLRRLEPPGSIRLALPGQARPGDYIYLPGTPLSRAVDSAQIADGYLQMDSVPAGRIEQVVLASAGPAADTLRGLGSDVAVAARRVTELAYTDWKHAGLVAIRLNELPGGLSGGVNGIPLLLRLDSGNFDFTQAANGGSDLRFTRDDGKPLAWHVQAWDPRAGAARIWINVDTVRADSALQKIRMYWGAPDTAKPLAGDGDERVFPAAQAWVGAWHFDAKPQGTPPHFPGAGERGVRALAQGALQSADSVVAGDSGVGVHAAHGIQGPGLHLNGTDSWLALEDTLPTPPGFTLSYWFRTSTREGGKISGFVMPGINGKIEGRPGNFNFDRVIWMDTTGLLRAGYTMAAPPNQTGRLGDWQDFVSTKSYNDGQWHHLTYSLSASAFHLYVDGEKVVGYTGTINSLSQRGVWRLGYLGEGMWDPMWKSEYFRGNLDEARLIYAPRSEDWIRLDQESQMSGSKLLQLERP